MKRLVATVLVALTLVSCQETPKGYVINGEVLAERMGKFILSPSGIRCFLISIRQN